MHTFGHVLQERLGELLVGRKLGEVHGDQQLFCLGIDIAHINAALMREQKPVTL